MDIFAENILDHYRHPRHKSPLPAGGGKGEGRLSHHEDNPSCGDTITLHLTIKNDRITEVAWQGEGCAISQAGMSLLSEELTGKSLPELIALTPQTMRDLLGVPVSTRRLKCALLPLHTLKNALHLMNNEKVQTWNETAEG